MSSKTAISGHWARVAMVLIGFGLLVGIWAGIDARDGRPWTAHAQSRIRVNTMFSAYDLSSTTYVYNGSGGAGTNDGWFTVATEKERAIQVDIATLNATSVEFVVEGRLSGESTAAQIWPASGNRSETATGSFIVYIPDAIHQVRLGMKITGDSGTQSIDAVLNTYAPDAR
jgi:hypothetical protein